MAGALVQGDLRVTGTITPQQMAYPAGSIVNADINANAAIAYTKCEQQVRKNYVQIGSASEVTAPIHIAMGATGEVLGFEAGFVAVPAGDCTVSVDLKKGTTSVLSSALELNSSSTNKQAQAATITTSGAEDYTDSDVFFVELSVNTGTGGTVGTNFFCELKAREDAS